MRKYSKYYNPEKIKAEKERKKKKAEEKALVGGSKYAKSVKNENIDVTSHIIVHEDVIKKRLVVFAFVLLMVVSAFSVVFQFVRIDNAKKSIEAGSRKITELEYVNDNIAYYNELYAYDQIFLNSIYDTTKMTYLLSSLWHYEVKINETLLTAENFDTLTVFSEGEDYSVVLYENMYIDLDNDGVGEGVFLPYNIAYKGSLCQGDDNDDISDHFLVRNVSNDGKVFNSKRTYPIDANGKKCLKIENMLSYTFEGNASATLYYTRMLADLLELNYIS